LTFLLSDSDDAFRSLQVRYFYHPFTSKRKGLVEEEWRQQYTADETALKSKSNHTVWN